MRMDELQRMDRTTRTAQTGQQQTRRSLLVPLTFAIVAICLSACAVSGRTDADLSASPFGLFEPQAAHLVSAEFVPGEWRYGTPAHCPYLTRVFITSDIRAASASLLAKAERFDVHPGENGDFGVRPFAVAGTQVEWLIFPVLDDDLKPALAKGNETAAYQVTIIVRDRSRAEKREPGGCRLPLSRGRNQDSQFLQIDVRERQLTASNC
jgi:hypothetical protein